MLCFEVHHNGKKLCTAGIGDYGVLTAILSWAAHRPEKLAKWQAQGVPAEQAVEMDLNVGGLRDGADGDDEQLRWVNQALTAGDEIRIRLVDVPAADPPVGEAADE